MKKLGIMAAICGLWMSCMALGICGVLGMYHFGKYSEYAGHLEYLDSSHEIVLHTENGVEKIDLHFSYDDEAELIIDDFQEVKVSGYYISSLNLLQVEEINEPDTEPIL